VVFPLRKSGTAIDQFIAIEDSARALGPGRVAGAIAEEMIRYPRHE
jgi:hypothetical protein